MSKSMVNRTTEVPIQLMMDENDYSEAQTTKTTHVSPSLIAPTLLQRRLFERHKMPLSDAIVVRDCDYDEDDDEEKKEETSCGLIETTGKVIVVEIKTLVWEVRAIVEGCYEDGIVSASATASATAKSTQNFYVVTALQMKDKIEMRKLKDLVLEKTKNTRRGALKSIRSMQLAPLEVAESLTGYQSGCMPPICHTNDGDMDLYVDQSIFDIYKIHSSSSEDLERRQNDTKTFASIGSGIPGNSLVLPLPQFLRVAGVDLEDACVNNTVANDASLEIHAGAGFVGSITSTPSIETANTNATAMPATMRDPEPGEGKTDNHGTSQHTSNEIKMMSGIEIRKLKQEERKEQREARKDRLKEYRSFQKEDILSKAKLLRTTARKKGRIPEMEELIQEALAVGDFPRLMEIPLEQNPRTNIDKNALHICAWRGDFETVVRLIEISNEHCPHLDVVNTISKGPGNYGKTPIFFALTQCREDVVKYLVQEAGADLLIVNNKGQTPCSIASSHVSDETCRLLYETEAKQLAALDSAGKPGDELFVNHRAGIHSDHKLYGDLDPRFPTDEDNRYFNEASRKSEEEKIQRRSKCKNNAKYDPKVFHTNYMDRTDDLSDQIREYEESVRLAPDESKIHGIPTQFSPRSLRPTVRWWNRDDQSLAKANDDSTSPGGQITFTQSRPRGRKVYLESLEEKKKEKDQLSENNSLPRFSEVDIDYLELISIDDVIDADVSSNNDENSCIDNNKIVVDNAQSLRWFEEEVDKWVSELNLDLESEANSDESTLESTLLKYVWGIDCEWKPGPDCGGDSPVSTLQLGTRKKAFLIDLQTICRSKDNLDEDDSAENDLDRILLKLFRNPSITLVGYGVLQDLGKLAASFPHLKCFSEFVSVVDLQSISSVVYNTKFDRKATSSLQKMTAMLLKKRLDKTQQVSDWSHRPLSEEQISYAMLDAAIIPLLLSAIFDNNAVIEGYNGRFFNVHKNLLSTIRYLPVEPCEDGYAYQIAYGSIKSSLGKAFARQSWPTEMKLDPPEPPKLVQVQQIPNDDLSTTTTSKKEWADLRKMGADAAGNIPKRPKPIPLKNLSGNLDNLPMPGMSLGYTKESCAFRVVGHELFKTIPEGTYIGFNRRAGVAETSNAWILFCNFGGDRVFSRFSDNGRKLSFRVNSTSQSGRSSEASLYRQMVSSSLPLALQESDEKTQILLFARESTRTKYLYCGLCTCTDVITLDEHTAGLVLKLEDYEELMDEKSRTSSDFEDLVTASRS
jgi:ankyrin repeat protein